jgi:hypothetical protein
MEKNLYLFVWQNVLCDHSAGVMFALAHDANEARELLRPGWRDRKIFLSVRPPAGVKLPARDSSDIELDKDPEIVTEPKGFSVSGGG